MGELMSTKIKMPCGCTVQETPFNQLELLYCPLHQAAQQLADATEAALKIFEAWEIDANPHKDLKRGESADFDAARMMVKKMESALIAAEIYGLNACKSCKSYQSYQSYQSYRG
jgi:hypothetical protein